MARPSIARAIADYRRDARLARAWQAFEAARGAYHATQLESAQ